MNPTLQQVAPQAPAHSRDWQPLADRRAAALATLREGQNLTDGVDVMLQREFGGRTAFIEHLPGALLH